MKRVIGIILCSVLLICSPVTYYGQEVEEDSYKTIDVEFSDNVGTTETIQIMVKGDHVYANAEQIGKRLGYSVYVGDEYVSIYNKKASDTVPYGATKFNFDSTEISHMLFNKTVSYEAEFESIKNEQDAWIPFQQSLLLLNSSVLVTDNSFLIEMPHKNIIDIFMDITANSNTYLFDWNKDFGYTDTDWTIIGTASHMVNLLNGILDLDGASWAQFIQSFMLKSDAYDDKYGQLIAELFCTYSDKELSEQVEEMKSVMQHFDGSGTFGKTLKALEKEIPSDVEIGQLQKTCESLKNDIYAGNGDIAKYNVTYQLLEQAVDKSSRFDDVIGNVLNAQKSVGNITGKLYSLAEVVGYASEFDNQDKFAVDALQAFVSKTDSSDTMSTQMKNSIKDYNDLLRTNIVTYSALTWLQNNYDKYIFKAMDLSEVLGTEATLTLIAWDFAKNLNVLGIDDKIGAADKFELAVYASIFQSDAFVNYCELRGQIFASESSITPENLYNVAQLCYTYLKSCYITRDAAIASLQAKTSDTQEKLRPLIAEQNAINESIAGCLVQLKDADTTNEYGCYGFLPSDNERYLKEHSSAGLQKIIFQKTYSNEWYGNTIEFRIPYEMENCDIEVNSDSDHMCIDIAYKDCMVIDIYISTANYYNVNRRTWGCYENFQIIKNNDEYYAYIILPDTIAQTNPEQYDFPYGEDVMNEYKSIFNYIDILTSSIEINLSDKEMDDEGTMEIKRKLCELVAAHYNEINNTDEFVAFEAEGECDETAEGYSITLRSQGFNSANVFVTMVYINTSTGEVTDDLGNTWMLDE